MPGYLITLCPDRTLTVTSTFRSMEMITFEEPNGAGSLKNLRGRPRRINTARSVLTVKMVVHHDRSSPGQCLLFPKNTIELAVPADRDSVHCLHASLVPGVVASLHHELRVPPNRGRRALYTVTWCGAPRARLFTIVSKCESWLKLFLAIHFYGKNRPGSIGERGPQGCQ